ncbi:MAG: SpoIIE family protein phosphatase [Anaerolineae bacterium]|nr:SpoIIE family protein phosphatase [Anaerolineae bacterium]
MEVQIGAAKVAKYATQESGDTLEIIERPHGGLSAVLVDGQRSGRSAKIISNIVARKAISLLGEGVRDGAVARAAHDYLRTHRGGRVSAELQVVSVDLQTETLVISRNTQCPALIVQEGALRVFDVPSQPIGIYAKTKPVIVEIPLKAHTYVLVFTDGLLHSGVDVQGILIERVQEGPSAQSLADALLSQALEAEKGRPKDDISVLVVAVLPAKVRDRVRRFSVRFPLYS